MTIFSLELTQQNIQIKHLKFWLINLVLILARYVCIKQSNFSLPDYSLIIK